MQRTISAMYAGAAHDFLECLKFNTPAYLSQLDRICFDIHSKYLERRCDHMDIADVRAIRLLYRELCTLRRIELISYDRNKSSAGVWSSI